MKHQSSAQAARPHEPHAQYQPQDHDYQARVQNSFAQQAFMATLGATISEIHPGSVRIDMPHADRLTQQHGFLHAGAVAAIADSACGYAALTLMPADAAVLTTEFKINLLAPAQGTFFYCIGRVRKAGRTLSYCTTEVYAQSEEAAADKLVAALVATLMTVQGRDLKD